MPLSKIVKINREGDLPGYQTYVARGLYEVDGEAALTAKLDEAAPRSPRRSPMAPESFCCPIGTPTPSWLRFPRCCLPPPCTTIWSGRRPEPRSG